jgi:dihydrofolate reductase
MIVAMSADRAIGRRGALPWHYKEDLQHFKTLTTGHAIIMGRVTFESIGKPLPNRRNIVISRSLGTAAGVDVVADLDAAVLLARTADNAPFVIGGSHVYREALPRATDLYVTLVPERTVEGADAYFPPFAESAFRLIDARDGATPGLVFQHWRRADDRTT